MGQIRLPWTPPTSLQTNVFKSNGVPWTWFQLVTLNKLGRTLHFLHITAWRCRKLRMFLPMLRHSIITTVLFCFWEVIILQYWLIINQMKGHDPCNFISITYFQSNSTTLVKKRLTMTTLIYLATLRNWPRFPMTFLFYIVSWSITHLTTHLCYSTFNYLSIDAKHCNLAHYFNRPIAWSRWWF